jgi:hypothetical protein
MHVVSTGRLGEKEGMRGDTLGYSFTYRIHVDYKSAFRTVGREPDRHLSRSFIAQLAWSCCENFPHEISTGVNCP